MGFLVYSTASRAPLVPSRQSLVRPHSIDTPVELRICPNTGITGGGSGARQAYLCIRVGPQNYGRCVLAVTVPSCGHKIGEGADVSTAHPSLDLRAAARVGRPSRPRTFCGAWGRVRAKCGGAGRRRTRPKVPDSRASSRRAGLLTLSGSRIFPPPSHRLRMIRPLARHPGRGRRWRS